MYFFLSLLIITLNVFAKEYPIKSKAPKLLNKDSTPDKENTEKAKNFFLKFFIFSIPLLKDN